MPVSHNLLSPHASISQLAVTTDAFSQRTIKTIPLPHNTLSPQSPIHHRHHNDLTIEYHHRPLSHNSTISQFTVAKKRNSIPPPLFTTSRYLATHLTASFYSFQSRPCTRSMFLHCKQGLPRDGFETGPQLQNFQLRSLRRDAKQKHEQGKRRQGHRCQGRTEMTRQEYAWTKRCWEKELPRKELSRGREVKGTRYQEKRLT